MRYRKMTAEQKRAQRWTKGQERWERISAAGQKTVNSLPENRVASMNKPPSLPEGKNFGKLGLTAAGLDLAVNTYFNVKNGDSWGTALLKGTGEAAAWAVAPGLMMTGMVAGMVPAAMTASTAANRALGEKYRNAVTPGTNFTYRDSRAALTMRQAAVQAIQGSKLNARNALGGEAALMHRGYTR